LQQLLKWTLETIRADEAMMSWLEEQRFEWTAAAAQAIRQIVEGRTVILVTDTDRKWFSKYITSSLNNPALDRPIMPIVCLDEVYPYYDEITGGEKIDMLTDMLTMSYGEEYFFWYVGKGDSRRSDIAKREDSSFLWIMDEDFQNSFPLRSYDKLLDIKLLHLYRIFDKTLNAVLFGEVAVVEQS